MPMYAVVIIVLVVLIAGGSAGYLAGYWSRQDGINRMTRDLIYYRATILTKSGSSLGYGPYLLRSIDTGQTWLNIDRETGAVTGFADPALLAHLDGVDALSAYVREHGPIGSHPITEQEIGLLEGFGFEVRVAQP